MLSIIFLSVVQKLDLFIAIINSCATKSSVPIVEFMYIRYIKGSPKVFEEKVPVLDTRFSEGSTQMVVLDIWLPKSCPWTLLVLRISSVQKYSFNKSA